jgi:transposase
MYQCQFSTEDLDIIRHQRYHHPDPVIRKRMTILWHKQHGVPHHTIAKLSGAAPNTVTGTLRTYLDQGLRGVQERKFYRPPSKLDPYREQLSAYFGDHPPRTLKEAAAEIERLTALSFTISHVQNFLLSIGLSRKKLEVFRDNWTTPSEQSKKPLLAIN